ncbi:jg17143 [Pararge aegeria aegeria]|uniref:Jg17143 protein n=1 Tax=Pararge aegeria aegeria TaxID=348720 RepID=A0A8S4RJE1_9NEOP|nr:jg17143 [Pararge aegeria aegeria]
MRGHAEDCSNAQAVLTATGSGTRRRRVVAIVELRYDSEQNDRKSSGAFGARAPAGGRHRGARVPRITRLLQGCHTYSGTRPGFNDRIN